MKFTVQLFGRFREFSATPEVALDLPGIATVAEFRAAFDAWAGTHWPEYAPGLLKASVIATESTLLCADSALPADGRLALLPPVSGELTMETDLLHDPRIACHVVDIADGPLDVQAAIDFVSVDAHGGIDVFIGRVRASSHGRECVAIHYDMFAPLALNVFRAITTAAVEHFGPKAKCHVAHAKGKLAVGDLAVVIAFGSPHRDEAFHGCREVIEAVKHQAPIWKQEHFIDGVTEWSEGCSLCGHEPASSATIQSHADRNHGDAHA